MAGILSIISIVSFVASGVCLVLAVFFWFKFGIPMVIGDLSGRNARKSIAQMRATNEKTGSKSYRSSSANVARGKITGKMADSDQLKNQSSKMQSDTSDRPETGMLASNRANPITNSEATGLLFDENETEYLEESALAPIKRSGGKKLTVIEEIILIHTNEVIE